jgi:hypothetical protein
MVLLPADLVIPLSLETPTFAPAKEGLSGKIVIDDRHLPMPALLQWR